MICRFADAEANFVINSSLKNVTVNKFIFRFTIALHLDDSRVLEHIQEVLQIGKVYYYDKVYFHVTRQEDIKKLIMIFNKYPLNSIKQLNYLSFKEAFEFYISELDSYSTTISKVEKINEYKSSMNKKRVDYNIPNRKFNISFSWLLGFIEGDGSF